MRVIIYIFIKNFGLKFAFAERVRRTLSEYLDEYSPKVRRILQLLGEREYFFGEFAKTLYTTFKIMSKQI